MATPNALAVALFNAAAGGYTAQIAADPNSLANAVANDHPISATYIARQIHVTPHAARLWRSGIDLHQLKS